MKITRIVVVVISIVAFASGLVARSHQWHSKKSLIYTLNYIYPKVLAELAELRQVDPSLEVLRDACALAYKEIVAKAMVPKNFADKNNKFAATFDLHYLKVPLPLREKLVRVIRLGRKFSNRKRVSMAIVGSVVGITVLIPVLVYLYRTRQQGIQAPVAGDQLLHQVEAGELAVNPFAEPSPLRRVGAIHQDLMEMNPNLRSETFERGHYRIKVTWHNRDIARQLLFINVRQGESGYDELIFQDRQCVAFEYFSAFAVSRGYDSPQASIYPTLEGYALSSNFEQFQRVAFRNLSTRDSEVIEVIEDLRRDPHHSHS